MRFVVADTKKAVPLRRILIGKAVTISRNHT